MSHLGSRVSALVDGRLGPEEEERCWAHVHACHTCRDLVEHEGWVKTQLAQLSYGASRPSHDFKSALVGRCSELSSGCCSSLTEQSSPEVPPDARSGASGRVRRARERSGRPPR